MHTHTHKYRNERKIVLRQQYCTCHVRFQTITNNDMWVLLLLLLSKICIRTQSRAFYVLLLLLRRRFREWDHALMCVCVCMCLYWACPAKITGSWTVYVIGSLFLECLLCIHTKKTEKRSRGVIGCTKKGEKMCCGVWNGIEWVILSSLHWLSTLLCWWWCTYLFIQ